MFEDLLSAGSVMLLLVFFSAFALIVIFGLAWARRK
jgi:uncharacterized BrkB/YihY/UPF0761 family membrane protein